jgi:chromosome condensin MukBEF MukE localization factor
MIGIRLFDLLSNRAGVELDEAVKVVPLRRESVRQAFYRLRKLGIVETVRAGNARFFFLVRNATRPVDDRGR